jgi:hypothetical protein
MSHLPDRHPTPFRVMSHLPDRHPTPFRVMSYLPDRRPTPFRVMSYPVFIEEIAIAPRTAPPHRLRLADLQMCLV